MLHLNHLQSFISWSLLVLVPIGEHSISHLALKPRTDETTSLAKEPTKLPDARETLFALRDRLQSMPRKLSAPDARKLAASSLVDVNTMVRGWTPESKIPPEYSASLKLPLRLLDFALQCEEEGPAFSALRAAADDLHIKAEHCRKTGVGPGEMVKVVIHTRNGIREQRNLEVFYIPKLLEAVKDTQPDQFPKVSSPTIHLLPPGRYVMWTREPQSKMIGARTLISIGDGDRTVEQTLPVP